jgi:hypothetical protein
MHIESYSAYRYCVYGIDIVSDTPLTMPRHALDPLRHVTCVRAPAATFDAATEGAEFHPLSDSWQRSAVLHDGSTYVGWDSVGEFLVDSDGRHIACRPAPHCSVESFQVYLLGQALSFALVKQHLEPLHATVVVIDGAGVAFLGGSAFGKSTLAASFLDAGCRLLTDDLLVVQESAGTVVAYPGPPRIKLFPEMADRFLGRVAGDRMNPDTGKLIVPLDESRTCADPVPLRALYVLSSPREACRQMRATTETLSPRDTVIELVKGTFNRRVSGANRVERQFAITARLGEVLPARRLTYPRQVERLKDVHDIVLSQLRPA